MSRRLLSNQAARYPASARHAHPARMSHPPSDSSGMISMPMHQIRSYYFDLDQELTFAKQHIKICMSTSRYSEAHAWSNYATGLCKCISDTRRKLGRPDGARGSAVQHNRTGVRSVIPRPSRPNSTRFAMDMKPKYNRPTWIQGASVRQYGTEPRATIKFDTDEPDDEPDDEPAVDHMNTSEYIEFMFQEIRIK